jgi:hypothetical protein
MDDDLYPRLIYLLILFPLLVMLPEGAGQGAGAVKEGGQPPLREQGPAQLHLHAP